MNTLSDRFLLVAPGSFMREVRSITVLLEPQPDGTLNDAAKLATWVRTYDAAFKQALGVVEGHSLHLLFGRTLNILGPSLLERIPAILTLADAARVCGLSVGVQLKVREVLEAISKLDALMQARPMASVFLDFRDIPESGELDSAALKLTEELLSAGLSLTFLSNPAVLQRIGALKSTIVNASNFQIIPSDAEVPDKAPMRNTGRAKRIIPIGSTSDKNAPPFDPCVARMQMFIGSDGYVYPCQGLAGLVEVALCHIDDPFDRIYFSQSSTHLDLTALLAAGPALPATPMGRHVSICDRHRHHLEATLAS